MTEEPRKAFEISMKKETIICIVVAAVTVVALVALFIIAFINDDYVAPDIEKPTTYKLQSFLYTYT
ncbi:hypothetical protein ACFL38_02765 [Candidatus Omnitrophota bacterium]